MGTRKNTFLLKRSNVAGKIPSAGDLLLGELALNTADNILYASGTTANSILPIGWDRIARTGDTMTGTLYVPTISATTYENLPSEFVCNTLSACTVIQDIDLEISGLTSQVNELSATTQSIQENYVPYTGATRDVDLGEHSISTTFINNNANQDYNNQVRLDGASVLLSTEDLFSTDNNLFEVLLTNSYSKRYMMAPGYQVLTGVTEPVDVGKIVWNEADGTFDMGLLNSVTLQAGQEIHMYAKANENISNGDAIQFAGAQGSHLLIKKAVPSEINLNPEYFIGIATQDFATNDFGYVTVFGQVRDLDTSMYSGGTVLYYQSSGTTNGLLTDVRPTGPKAKIIVAAVVRSHITQGAIFVRPHVMPMIGDLQNVEINNPQDSEVLTYDSDSGVWVNKVLPSSVDGSGTTNYVPKFTASETLGNSQIYDNGTNVGIGTTSPSAKLHLVDTTLAGSGALSGSILNLEQTWNTTGTPTAIKLNVTDTTSNASSLLMDLKVGGDSRFKVDKSGNIDIIANDISQDNNQYIIKGGRPYQVGTIKLFNKSTGGMDFTSWNGAPFNFNGNINTTGGLTFGGSLTLQNNQRLNGNSGSYFMPYDGSTGHLIIRATTINNISRIRLQNGSSSTDKLTVFPTGNILIQNGGSHIDSGYNLDVNGTQRIQGTLELTNNTGFGIYQSGTATNSFAGNVGIGTTSPSAKLHLVDTTLAGSGALSGSILNLEQTWNTTGTPTAIKLKVTNTASGGNGLLIDLRLNNSTLLSLDRFGQLVNNIITTTAGDISTPSSSGLNILGTETSTSGTGGGVRVNRNLITSTGSGVFNGFSFNGYINQTGGANGITRGLYINPTLTSASDWRSIEWSNNTGRGLWGSGTANNAMAGSLNVGAAANANGSAILEATSTTQGFLPPRMTTTQRNAIASPAAGLVIYNTTTNTLDRFNGTTWNAFESVDNKVTDLNTPNNTTYPTTLAVVNENKKANITVELIDLLTTNFYAPNALRINSTALISGSGTITLKVNDVAYTLGNLIAQGAKITVETTTASVYNLISVYE